MNSTGVFWASDDKDDLYGELITDAYTALDTATLTAAVGAQGRNNGFRLFPNPAGDFLTLECTGVALQDGAVQILGIFGRLLHSRRIPKGQRLHRLPVNMLPAGRGSAILRHSIFDSGEIIRQRAFPLPDSIKFKKIRRFYPGPTRSVDFGRSLC